MEKKKITYRQDGDMWLGYFEEYPDYMTQGETLDELKENLRDIETDILSDQIKIDTAKWKFNRVEAHER
ncbi:MAG: hypothetical protein JEZ11_10110 [Desulfobacterales bacterium]|nr:hypothetical protein [Desulfobacterales bacterium]